MRDGKLKIDIRRGKILEILKKDGRVFVSELCKTLGVTPVTIRTDLNRLENDGYIQRISGGAVYLGEGAESRIISSFLSSTLPLMYLIRKAILSSCIQLRSIFIIRICAS